MEVVDRTYVEEALHKAARLYLLDHLGHLLYPSKVRHDAARNRWVATIMCHTERGDLPAGAMELDDNGNVVAAPSKEQISATVSRMIAETPVLVKADPEELRRHGFEVIAP